MASKQSPYDALMANVKKSEDYSDNFNMIINNPYRILGASTYCTEAELRDIYQQWESAPDKYKPKFDKTKLGPPERTEQNMNWALENADSYVYKIFWFSDAEIASRLGNKGDFIEFFSKPQSINSTDYNSFLAQYIFLCIFDRNFTMAQQWTIMLNLINELLNVSVGRFWGFFSGNKIEAIDNNKMAFLYNEFKDNILYPIRELLGGANSKVVLEEIIHIHKLLATVQKPQLSFSRIQNQVYEKMERWFVKESDYVNNVLLAKVTGVSASSMEEKLAITNACNYIINTIAPQFRVLVDDIIPEDHPVNTKLRMMFSGKFIVVSKILSNAGMYHESLNLYQLFNQLFADDYIAGEINTLSKLIKQDEQTRMAPHAASTLMGNPVLMDESLAPPAELGELEALEKERRKEFFKRNVRTGIDYKEVIQGVLNNELRLVKDEEEDVPLIDRVMEEAAAEAEAETVKLRCTIEELQRKHEQEMRDKIEELNREYKQSMKKWVRAIVIILVLTVSSVGVLIHEFTKSDIPSELNDAAASSAKAAALEETLKTEKTEIDDMEAKMSELNADIAQLTRDYETNSDETYAQQLVDKRAEYNDLLTQHNEKVAAYNKHLQEYNSTQN
ncbi:hypothetical protein Ami103574_12940 [Aminipila butyrica]|uniref:Uncharacterized protein n=1 Tax=Aminipila butyrica TaxID=433296 RepID=A0A858BZ05_9FIRM|nr:hypothetical protein [Aminipila butyrica]QIB70140.1 hypothetical protein Ami103574_12940 [Aminipila butyrica]